MKNTITKIRNTLEGIKSRLMHTERCINDLEDRVMENTQAEQQDKKIIFKNEDRLKDLLNNKWTNIFITQIPEEAERVKGAENLFEEIIAENFPNLRR